MIMPDGPKRKNAIRMYDAIHAVIDDWGPGVICYDAKHCTGCSIRDDHPAGFDLKYCSQLMTYVLYELNCNKFQDRTKLSLVIDMNAIACNCVILRN